MIFRPARGWVGNGNGKSNVGYRSVLDRRPVPDEKDPVSVHFRDKCRPLSNVRTRSSHERNSLRLNQIDHAIRSIALSSYERSSPWPSRQSPNAIVSPPATTYTSLSNDDRSNDGTRPLARSDLPFWFGIFPSV